MFKIKRFRKLKNVQNQYIVDFICFFLYFFLFMILNDYFFLLFHSKIQNDQKKNSKDNFFGIIYRNNYEEKKQQEFSLQKASFIISDYLKKEMKIVNKRKDIIQKIIKEEEEKHQGIYNDESCCNMRINLNNYWHAWILYIRQDCSSLPILFTVQKTSYLREVYYILSDSNTTTNQNMKEDSSLFFLGHDQQNNKKEEENNRSTSSYFSVVIMLCTYSIINYEIVDQSHCIEQPIIHFLF